MYKVILFTILSLGLSCEVPVKKRVPETANKITTAEIKISNEVERISTNKPKGKIPLPEALRIQTEKTLELDETSAEALAKQLEQDIKK